MTPGARAAHLRAMERKTSMDSAGAALLIGCALLFGLNNVTIKVANGGFQPLFQAGLRSLGAVALIGLWMALRGIPLPRPGVFRRGGLLIGLFFTGEFLCLYIALDLTTVTRASIVFYSMPVWLALAAHVLLPGERLSAVRLSGLALAMAGVAWALLDRPGGGAAAPSLLGDVLALAAAMFWAGIPLVIRLTGLARERAETQLFCQLAVSAPLFLGLAALGGPLLRDPALVHVAAVVYQFAVVASVVFLVWFWLISIYPASAVASFSFLTPVASVALGWWLLDEPVGPGILGALALVAAGLYLVNRPARAPTPA
ncbi:DMT family transporter [Rhodosalinus sediminis]